MRRRWVVAGVGVAALGVAAVVVLQQGGSRPATAEEVAVTQGCIEAAQAKLQPLVTYASDKWTSEQSGTQWTVRTSVNHKTDWADHWYDVTCVVTMPQVSVLSVETVAR